MTWAHRVGVFVMKPLPRLVICMLIGWFLGNWLGLQHLETEQWYRPVTAALLAVGLYASTYGIVLEKARKHFKLIVAAVTIGVLLKALLIGGSLWALSGLPIFWVLAINVSQIDPLSVANLEKTKMSKDAYSILGAWSSFDDPMTVLLGLYVPALLVAPAPGTPPIVQGGLGGYALGLGLNLVFAGVVFLVWRFTRLSAANVTLVLLIGYLMLAFSFATAIMCLMMLGLALIGLFLRPDHFERVINGAVKVALVLATILLGVLLVHGVNVLGGLGLGIAAYVAQVVVAVPLTRKLPRADRVHLMFAQQNGITAIILSLLFEPAYPGTVAIVAPAIVVTNLLHTVMNKWAVPRFLAWVG